MYLRLFKRFDEVHALCEQALAEIKALRQCHVQAGIQYKVFAIQRNRLLARCLQQTFTDARTMQGCGHHQIIDVNKASLDLHQAKNKEELLKNLSEILGEESYNEFAEELVHIAQGDTRYEWEAVNRTLEGRRLNVRRMVVADGIPDEATAQALEALISTHAQLGPAVAPQ